MKRTRAPPPGSCQGIPKKVAVLHSKRKNGTESRTARHSIKIGLTAFLVSDILAMCIDSHNRSILYHIHRLKASPGAHTSELRFISVKLHIHHYLEQIRIKFPVKIKSKNTSQIFRPRGVSKFLHYFLQRKNLYCSYKVLEDLHHMILRPECIVPCSNPIRFMTKVFASV